MSVGASISASAGLRSASAKAVSATRVAAGCNSESIVVSASVRLSAEPGGRSVSSIAGTHSSGERRVFAVISSRRRWTSWIGQRTAPSGVRGHEHQRADQARMTMGERQSEATAPREASYVDRGQAE